jgi:hypothetical protein
MSWAATPEANAVQMKIANALVINLFIAFFPAD